MFPGDVFSIDFLALVTSSRVYHSGVILSFAQNSIEADELSVVLDIVYYFRLGLILFLSQSWIFVFFLGKYNLLPFTGNRILSVSLKIDRVHFTIRILFSKI